MTSRRGCIVQVCRIAMGDRPGMKPAVAPQDVAALELELASVKEWQSAYARGEQVLRELPERGDQQGFVRTALGLALHLGLICMGCTAGRLGIGGLKVWAAREEINLDRFWYEPASCGLNHAYTRLGLALLAKGDELGAFDCLRAGWHIHPCPHNTSFGLDARLWSTLVGVPAADHARGEYAEIARKFSPDGLRRVVHSLWTSLSNSAYQRTRPSGRAAERHGR